MAGLSKKQRAYIGSAIGGLVGGGGTQRQTQELEAATDESIAREARSAAQRYRPRAKQLREGNKIDVAVWDMVIVDSPSSATTPPVSLLLMASAMARPASR